MTKDNNIRIMAVKKSDGSDWIVIEFVGWEPNSAGEHPRLRPSLENVHKLLRGIAWCEDRKYQLPAKGRFFFLQFVIDCFFESNYSVLAQKYNIPEWDGDRLVRTNGGRVGLGVVDDDDY